MKKGFFAIVSALILTLAFTTNVYAYPAPPCPDGGDITGFSIIIDMPEIEHITTDSPLE